MILRLLRELETMNSAETSEYRQIQKEDAIEKIAGLVSYHQISLMDLAEIFPELSAPKAELTGLPEAKLFDPFFDVQ